MTKHAAVLVRAITMASTVKVRTDYGPANQKFSFESNHESNRRYNSNSNRISNRIRVYRPIVVSVVVKDLWPEDKDFIVYANLTTAGNLFAIKIKITCARNETVAIIT